MIHTATTRTRPSKDNIIGGHILTIDTISRGKITFFDSYGRFETLKYPRLKRIIKKSSIKRFEANSVKYQGDSTICPHLSLYFLLLRARGFTLTQIQRDKFSSIHNNLITIPAIIESLLPASIQAKRKKKGVRHDLRAFSHE